MTRTRIAAAFASIQLLAAQVASGAVAAPGEESAPVRKPHEISVEDDAGFQRYRMILDRLPFGSLPAGFDPNAPTAAEAAQQEADAKKQAAQIEELMKKAKMSAFNTNPDGKVFIGISVQQDKISRTYYLAEGETQDGWEFVSADRAACSAKVRKDGIEAVFSLGGGAAPEVAASSGTPDGGASASRHGAAAQSASSREREFRKGPRQDDGQRRSYAADLRARRAAERSRARELAEAEQRRADDIAKREQELSREQEKMRSDFEKLRVGIEEALRRENEDRARNEGGGDQGGEPAPQLENQD